MSSSETSSAPRATLWLRSLSLLVLGLGLAAEQGRVVSEATGQCILHSTGPLFDRFGHATGYSFLDPFFCMLLSFFREILIYPAGRASGLLFASLILPFLLNLLWRARTRSQVFKAFLFAAVSQILTFGATAALFYSPTQVPSMRAPKKTSKTYTYLVQHPRKSVSRIYVLWVVVVLTLTMLPLLGLVLTPTENDAVYIWNNGIFQLYPVVLLLGLLVNPLGENISLSTGRTATTMKTSAGIRLIVFLLGLVSWLSALLWWTGIFAFFIRPSVTNEAARGRTEESISPIITSVLNGDWKWQFPNITSAKGGPIFFAADLISSTLAVWSSQIEGGFKPSVVQAIVLGPSFAITRSMRKMWAHAV